MEGFKKKILHECSCIVELIKRVGKPRILSLFRNEFNKFNYTGTRMLDYIYHMTLKLLYYQTRCPIINYNPKYLGNSLYGLQ